VKNYTGDSALNLLTVGSKFTRPACCAAAAAVDQYHPISPDLSSKPAGRHYHCRSTGQTDGDGRTLDRFMMLTAYYVNHVEKKTIKKLEVNGEQLVRQCLYPGTVCMYVCRSARTNRRTTQKHNASSGPPIYWIDGSMLSY